MTLVVAVTLAAALLSIGAGVGKLVAPQGAVLAVRAVGLPASHLAVRAMAVVEVAVGSFVLVSPSPLWRALLAGLFVGIVAFALASLRARVGVPCGCFGGGGRAIGARHVIVDMTVVLAATASVLLPHYPTNPVFEAGVLAGVCVLMASACTAALTAALLARGSRAT